MVERIANLYTEKALNDKLFAEGLISEEMHRMANEGIILDIDAFAEKEYAFNVVNNRSMADGFAKRTAAAG